MKPKDFQEFMTGFLTAVITFAVLAIAGAEIFTRSSGSDAWRGALIVAFAACYGYWVGSSSGSKQKTDGAIELAKVENGHHKK